MLPLLAAAAVSAAPVATPAPPADPQAVQTVEITARRPVTGTLLQGTQAYQPEFFTPARPSTAMDMIKWLPGFTFEDVRDLRGLGGAIGNVLIDGKPPTSKTDTLSTVLSRIPSNQVERVDIIVGGAPGIDMRGREVIANVVLKKTEKTKLVVNPSVAALQDGRVLPEILFTAARNSGGRNWDVSLTAADRLIAGPAFGDGPWERRDGDGNLVFRAQEQNRSSMPLVIATGAYEFPLAGGKLKLNALGRYQHPVLGDFAVLERTGERYTLKGEDIYRQGELGLRYERAFGRTTLEAQALRRMANHDNGFVTYRPPIDTDFREHDDGSETVARATLRFKRDEALTVEASGEGAINTMDTNARLISAGRPTPIPAANVRIEEDRGEFGLLASWKVSKTVGLTAQMKVETSTLTSTGDVDLTRTLTYWKPRAVFSWTADKSTQLRLRAEREVGQINFFNFVAGSEFNSGTIRAGNPNLRPQRTWIAEAVLERQFWTGASAVATLRRRAISGVVDVRAIGDSGAVGIGNIGDADATDAIVTVTLPLKAVGLNGAMAKGALTRTWSRVTDPTTGERRDISGVSRTIGELHLTYDLPRLKLTFGADGFYIGRFTLYRPAGREGSSGFTRLNLTVEYRPRPDLSLRAEVWNVTSSRPTQFVEAYTGFRHVSPLDYVDERRLGVRPYLFLRVRKTVN